MHYCTKLVGGAPGSQIEPCDQPASVRYEGEWLCHDHYEALVDLEAHWQTLLRAADHSEPYEFADVYEDDSGLVEFEATEIGGLD